MPVLKRDFGELEEKMRSTGAIMEAETAVKLKMLADRFTLLSSIITSQLGPALIKLVEFIYGSVLKAGQTTASASAFYGAGTAKKGVLGTAGALLKTAGLGAMHMVGLIDTKDLKARVGKTIDLPVAKRAGEEAGAPWQKRIDQFSKMMKDAEEKAKELQHPKPPDFSKNQLPMKTPSSALRAAPDSLTRVGNFLGGMGIAQSVEQKKVGLLQQIAQNTKPQGKGTPAVPGWHGASFGGGLVDVVWPHR